MTQLYIVCDVGSSPLTRGKPNPRDVMQNTFSAHPRSRGENFNGLNPATVVGGSSPLTRGKPLRVRAPGNGQGLIPAHAGKTSLYRADLSNNWAHPRSRGENSETFSLNFSAYGSSPLTRGKPPRRSVRRRSRRLIPAHAGKTRGACDPPGR